MALLLCKVPALARSPSQLPISTGHQFKLGHPRHSVPQRCNSRHVQQRAGAVLPVGALQRDDQQQRRSAPLPSAPAGTPLTRAAENAAALLNTVSKWLVLAGAVSCLSLGTLDGKAEELVRFPASSNPAIFAAQKTLAEAWMIVGNTFVDGSFGGMDWEHELVAALQSTYAADTGDQAYKEIAHMLDKLGDPFTRIVPPEEYANYLVAADGEVQGVGLLIATDPTSGKLVVLAPVSGGPAERAGMQPGDEVVSIDGSPTTGWDGDKAAHSLRGRQGSSVMVQFARRSEQIPGVPGRPETPPRVEYKQVRLQREKVKLTPIWATALRHGDHTLGYIRLTNFSQRAAQEMQQAVENLQAQDVDGFILDLRNNPGGLVTAGLDVARLWLSGHPTIFNVQGREVAGQSVVQRVILDEGNPLSDKPLAVLVNGHSASASEILAGALHDNGRAELIGDDTFGKGRIQSVFELGDGSGLFVTVAKYKTPNMEEIDKVGIHPDRACSRDSRADEAPVGVVSQNTLLAQLQADSCILTAETFLDSATSLK